MTGGVPPLPHQVARTHEGAKGTRRSPGVRVVPGGGDVDAHGALSIPCGRLQENEEQGEYRQEARNDPQSVHSLVLPGGRCVERISLSYYDILANRKSQETSAAPVHANTVVYIRYFPVF